MSRGECFGNSRSDAVASNGTETVTEHDRIRPVGLRHDLRGGLERAVGRAGADHCHREFHGPGLVVLSQRHGEVDELRREIERGVLAGFEALHSSAHDRLDV